MIAMYVPGTGILHRLPTGAKLAGLAVAALVLSLSRPGVVGTVVVLTVVSALYPAARLPWRVLGLGWWRLRWLIVVLGAAVWAFVSAEAAIESVGRIVALILLADLVTRSTRTGDLLDVLRRLMHPLRRLGVDPDAVALTVSLTIAMVPVVAVMATQVRDAQRARGIRLGPRAALPLLVLVMQHADDVGDALAARGLAS